MPHANIEFVAPISKKNIKYTEDLDLSQLGKPELRRYQQAMYQRKRQQMKTAAAAKKKDELKTQNCRDCRVELINVGFLKKKKI